LVLVVAPARLFARGAAYWAVRYELRSVSARNESAGADLSVRRDAPFPDFTTISYVGLDVAAK